MDNIKQYSMAIRTMQTVNEHRIDKRRYFFLFRSVISAEFADYLFLSDFYDQFYFNFEYSFLSRILMTPNAEEVFSKTYIQFNVEDGTKTPTISVVHHNMNSDVRHYIQTSDPEFAFLFLEKIIKMS